MQQCRFCLRFHSDSFKSEDLKEVSLVLSKALIYAEKTNETHSPSLPQRSSPDLHLCLVSWFKLGSESESRQSLRFDVNKGWKQTITAVVSSSGIISTRISTRGIFTNRWEKVSDWKRLSNLHISLGCHHLGFIRDITQTWRPNLLFFPKVSSLRVVKLFKSQNLWENNPN